MEADSGMSRLLHRVMALAEGYPELKASRSVDELQRTLNEVEAQIAAARRTYNAAATELNTAIEVFPQNLVAKTLGFALQPLFAADADEKVTPRAMTA
jgi:LemA protein